MPYDELIKRLREATNDWPDKELHYEAADAIEELQKQLDEETEFATALNSYEGYAVQEENLS